MKDARYIRRIEQADAAAFYGMKQREFNKDYYKIGVIDARVATVIRRRIDECIERGWDTMLGEIY